MNGRELADKMEKICIKFKCKMKKIVPNRMQSITESRKSMNEWETREFKWRKRSTGKPDVVAVLAVKWQNGFVLARWSYSPFLPSAGRRWMTERPQWGCCFLDLRPSTINILSHVSARTRKWKREVSKEIKKRVHRCLLKAWYRATSSLSSEVKWEWQRTRSRAGAEGGAYSLTLLPVSPPFSPHR